MLKHVDAVGSERCLRPYIGGRTITPTHHLHAEPRTAPVPEFLPHFAPALHPPTHHGAKADGMQEPAEAPPTNLYSLGPSDAS